MLGTFSNAWKVKELRNKLLYILLVLLIFRVGSVIPVPGLSMDMLREHLMGMGSDGGFLAMLVGGEWGTIFTMGIGPYITASIIMQLLTVAIPKLAELKKRRRRRPQKNQPNNTLFSCYYGFGTSSGYDF
jgi:preprotein translocase subunit SecY